MSECRLVVELCQVGELVLLAPEPQVKLALGSRSEALSLDQVRVQRARLGDHLEDLLLLEGERVSPLHEQDLNRLRLPGVGDDLALDLAAASQDESCQTSPGPGTPG